jgi:hypothetical protein
LRKTSRHVWLAALLFAGTLIGAVPAAAQTGGSGPPGGTTSTTTTTPTAPSGTAQLQADGTAIAPSNAPRQVRKAIAAGNKIHTRPYIWGGGHRSFKSRGYDCSGAVSYVLHAAGLLRSPLSSGPLMGWGAPGIGSWITVYANSSHAWMTVAGLRFDTSAVGESLNGAAPATQLVTPPASSQRPLPRPARRRRPGNGPSSRAGGPVWASNPFVVRVVTNKRLSIASDLSRLLRSRAKLRRVSSPRGWERGNQIQGRTHRQREVGAQAPSAPARQLTPQACKGELFDARHE